MAGGNIKVVVRVRPFNGRELDRKAKCVVQMKDNQTILVPPPDAEERLRKSGGKSLDGQKVFAYDKSYWSFNRADGHFAGQDNLFDDLGAPLLDNAFQGYNNCIFAYGQTGSGKSYSMMGYGEEAGVIPRICRNMFERIADLQKDKNLTYTVEVSYLEIYNERVRDLLNPTTKGNLKVREHPSTGPYVEDLAKLVVRSFPEIQHLMDEGNKARTVAATNMNETSSRSHAVFTLTVTQKRHDEETRMDTEKVAKISLVDLAGSERATSTGATGARLKEGAEINRSLSTLGRVIAALADLSTGKKKIISMVPYRDSVLTWLLKDSLGGNSMTAMIAAISPADINFEETLSTLRYADSAKRIKNHAVVNEDPNARMIRELKEELAQLRAQMNGGALNGAPHEEQYAPDTPLDKQIVSIVQADGSIKKVSKADIAEQLNQSEKLYQDLNQTWEDKLIKTEEIHKEREAALEELGISIEKGFVGLSTPKKMPHLVNLSDDPLLAECLVYNIKPGTTSVGNVDDLHASSEIRLNGSKILKDHCTFENVDGLVTVVPKDGAVIMVNGLRIDKPTRLRSGNRVILGDFHIFRFNHPQEARDERKEQSLLRHAVTASQLGSPTVRPGHSRKVSKATSDIDGDLSRSESPSRSGRDSDWSFARREAASAILGADQKIAHLTDDELDNLFDDVQRARAVRKGRPESRLFVTDDEEADSVSTYPFREKYMSTGTIDNFSLDTALTLPSTPPPESVDGEDEAITSLREQMQGHLDYVGSEQDSPTRGATPSPNIEAEKLKVEKERIDQELRSAREEFEALLKQQRDEFDAKIRQLSPSPSPRVEMNGALVDDIERAKPLLQRCIARWQRSRNVSMTETLLRYSAVMKEAQILSQAMDKHVSFQFMIIDEGQHDCSSYDLVLSGISGDEDDALDSALKPCVAIRIIDYKSCAIRLWSVDKFEARFQNIKEMHQYLGRPDHMQHFKSNNPFIEPCMPQFSLVGEAMVSLAAVFEARVQDYSLEVLSPYTHEAIGILRLSLEPSSAQAPSSMLKFNVVMHNMTGFAEREGTEIHAQMSVPGISEEGGATTTQMIQDFDENPIQFESVHNMGVPTNGPRDSFLRIAIHGRAATMHLDKLLSWDEIRVFGKDPSTSEEIQSRVSEAEYHKQEQHDVFSKAQIFEMSETGEYFTVDVEQNSNIDPGTYQLRQGLQRRIAISLIYSSVESMGWKKIKSVRVGKIRLLDPGASVPHAPSPKADVQLKTVQEPKLIESGSGNKEVTVLAQWDSSLHGSQLLDRPTAEGYTVQVSVTIDILSSRTSTPLSFAMDLHLQIRPRSWLRPQSMFKQLWKTTRVIHSTSSMFNVVLTPASSKNAGDVWRHNSQHEYIKGEETLGNWRPRDATLVQDWIKHRRKRRLILDVQATKVILASHRPSAPQIHPSEADRLSPSQLALLTKCLNLWPRSSNSSSPPVPDSLSPSSHPLSKSTSLQPPHPPPLLHPTVHLIPKSPTVLKSSYLLTPLLPTSSTTPGHPPIRWHRQFAELRPPYLHIYAVPSGEQTTVINLRHARVDLDPPVRQLLVDLHAAQGSLRHGWERNIFAVYGAMNTWLFAVRSEGEKGEWVLAIDEAFMGVGSG